RVRRRPPDRPRARPGRGQLAQPDDHAARLAGANPRAMAVGLADLLRAGVGSGDGSGLRERLAPDAVLRTSNERGRVRVDGADAIVAHLARAGSGEISVWEAQEW